MTNIAIFGVTSAIAQATGRLMACDGTRFCLIGRNAEQLEIIKQDYLVRGASDVFVFPCDLASRTTHQDLVDNIMQSVGQLDIVLLAHGVLPDQAACEEDPFEMSEAFEVNALSHMSLLTVLANVMAQHTKGTLAVITSVAGVRGRKSNYVYGAAKGAVSIFLDGLRHRLSSTGVQVLDIRPGFVDTPMTADFEKGPLWASPEDIARGILKAIEKRKDVTYLPHFWWWIMMIIRHLPRFVMHKTGL